MASLMKFTGGGRGRGASGTLDHYNSIKIRENTENVLPGLWILFHPNTMC